MKDPVKDYEGDRQALATEVIEIANKKVSPLVSTSCDALGYGTEAERWHLKQRVIGAVQAYSIYRSGTVNYPKQEVLKNFASVRQSISPDLGEVIVRHVENVVDDAVDAKLRENRKGGKREL